ncbi:hypothetical protein BY996DRAFT_4584942 [Phakopsora pachyrhizi]|nr:hypothetical protein BY996DRAFT_4584942 [Phakopsora pachyrhizi]
MNFGPSLPPDRPSEDASAEELWDKAGWNEVPLFMNKLPDSTTKTKTSSSSNQPLEALQALIYDSDQEDDAEDWLEPLESLKQRGNELFRSKDYRQALGFYNQSSDWIENLYKKQKEKPERSGKNVPDELERSIYSNRSACHLALGNNRSCLNDCLKALKPPLPRPITRAIVKSYFRASKSLLRLERFEEALKNVEELIGKIKSEMDDSKSETKENYQEIYRLRDEIDQKIRLENQRLNQIKLDQVFEMKKNKILVGALRSRGVILDESRFPPNRSKLPPGLEPVHFEDETFLNVPLIYPVYVYRPKDIVPSRDLILSWNENDLMIDHLQNLVQQEEAGGEEVVANGLGYRFYLISFRKKIMRCGNKMTFKKIAQNLSTPRSSSDRSDDCKEDGLELGCDGQLELFLLAIGKAETEWIAETKKNLLKG